MNSTAAPGSFFTPSLTPVTLKRNQWYELYGTFYSTVSGSWTLTVRNNTDYADIVPEMPVYTQAHVPIKVSFLFQSPVSSSDVRVSPQRDLPSSSNGVSNIYMKELVLRTVKVTSLEPRSQILFNPSTASKKFSLPDNEQYITPQNKLVENEVTVGPYSSVILWDKGPLKKKKKGRRQVIQTL